VAIDARTGQLPYPDDPEVMDEVFLAGTEPVETAAPPAVDAGAGDGGVVDGAMADVE
jgi:hypothetical protein